MSAINFIVRLHTIYKRIPELALISALIGGAYQFIILFFISEGLWVLPYFSVAYSLIEGLPIFFYTLSFLVFDNLFLQVNDKLYNKSRLGNIAIGVLTLGLIIILPYFFIEKPKISISVLFYIPFLTIIFEFFTSLLKNKRAEHFDFWNDDLKELSFTQVSHPVFTGLKTIIYSMKTKGNPWFYCIFKLLDQKYKTCYNTKILLKFKS